MKATSIKAFNKLFVGFLGISVILFVSCEKDDGSLPPFEGTVSGTVTDTNTGDPIEGVNIELKQGDNTIRSTTTNEQGNFSITEQVQGEEVFSITATLNGYEDFTFPEFTLTSGNQKKEADIPLQPKAKIQGVVKHSVSEKVLENVLVRLSPEDLSTSTDEFGAYEFTGLDAGTYELSYSKSGFESQEQSIQLQAGDDKQNDISLEALPSVLMIDKEALDFGTTETVFPIVLENTGGDTVIWSIIENIPWASVNPLSGKITTEPETINVSVDRNGFDPGNYSQTMTISSNGGTKTVNLTMTIQGAILQIIPSEISFGIDKTKESIQLTRIGQGTLNYDIQSDKSWLTSSPTSGSVTNEIDFIELTVDRLSLDIGNHSAKLAFNTDNGSQVVNVSITIPDPNAPQLSIDPLAFNFGTDDASRVITLSNTGKGSVSWNVTKSTSWLTVGQSSGELQEDESFNLPLTVNRAALQPDSYNDVLRFTSNGGSINVPVDMEVANVPVLSLDKSSLSFPRGVEMQTFDVSNIGNGTMTWQVSTNQNWISINPTNGNNNGTVNITVSREGLDFGNYSGQVDIESDGGVGLVTIDMVHLPPNDPPVAAFTLSRATVDLNEEITLDASMSSDVQDATSLLEVRWKYEVSASFTNWSTDKFSSISYPAAGIKTITLEVRDTEQEITSLSKDVTVVMNQAPIAMFSVDPTSGERSNTNFQFDASSSTDDIDLLNDLQVRWEWDSGLGFTDWTKTKTAEHSYDTEGTKTVTTEVQDTHGLISDFSLQIEVVSNGDMDDDGVPDLVDADDDNNGLIEIFTINDLDNIRNDLTATGTTLQGAPAGGFTGYELMNDLDFSNSDHYSDISLKADVTSGSGWNPIGLSTGDDFNTIFDGNGFTISNLLIDRTTDNTALIAFTGISSQVRNLRVEIKFLSGDQNSAGLIGINRGDVTNCSVSGRVTSTNENTGLLIGNHRDGDVVSCYSDGEVVSTDDYAGGLIGATGWNSGDTPTISYSYSTASIQARGNIGGLLGGRRYSNLEMRSCYATGSVNSSYWYVGGLVGRFVGDMFSCYATGNVSATNNTVGGLIGTNTGTIRTSYSLGTVSGAGNLGGFAGVGGSGISSSNYWDTQTSGLTTSSGSATGLTTAQLQSQTTANGIYITWNPDQWDFGSATEYPVLKNMPNGIEAQRN